MEGWKPGVSTVDAYGYGWRLLSTPFRPMMFIKKFWFKKTFAFSFGTGFILLSALKSFLLAAELPP